MTKLVPVSDGKAILTALVQGVQDEDEDVLFTKHGRPAAVMMSPARYETLLERLDDLEDRLSVYEREGVTISLEKLEAELGLNGEDD